jgi:beta-glucosidase
VFGGQTGDIACDHYHRYEEDIKLLADAGIRNYRLSVAWSRVLLDGIALNGKGLDFYDRLIDCCLAHDIQPHVTIYHWDLPEAIEDKGGWQNRDTAERLAEFASIFAGRVKGRVKAYYTLNEIQCQTVMGFLTGEHAPGLRLGNPGAFKVMCNFLRAHGLVSRAIRAIDPSTRISIASTGRVCYPSSEADDLEAARAATFKLYDDDWGFTHSIVLDPIVFGRFPDAKGSFLDALIDRVPDSDIAEMHEPPDLIGLNIYQGKEVRTSEGGGFEYVPNFPGYPRTALKWPITPECLRYGPRYVWERYGIPIQITESGLSLNDRVFLDGKVHDPERIDYLTRHLAELKKALADGADIRAYFHWSSTDNFEWHTGYDERFGLIYIDYPTQKRIPKDSLEWYGGIIRTNGASL